MARIILASASPRRTALLDQIRLPHVTMPVDINEEYTDRMVAHDIVSKIALDKALVASKVAEPDDIVLAADTVVVKKGEILGKPADQDDARRMLRLLRKSTHDVLTGFALVRNRDGKTVVDYSKTAVTFRDIDDNEIEDYIMSGEPMDKAGAYGIQGLAAAFVSGISGDYYNVVGLPLCAIVQVLRKEYDFGIVDF